MEALLALIEVRTRLEPARNIPVPELGCEEEVDEIGLLMANAVGEVGLLVTNLLDAACNNPVPVDLTELNEGFLVADELDIVTLLDWLDECILATGMLDDIGLFDKLDKGMLLAELVNEVGFFDELTLLEEGRALLVRLLLLACMAAMCLSSSFFFLKKN
jgi:hypothetical protein